jgi:16S rRNA (guanine527-N7)-methyltransferase
MDNRKQLLNGIELLHLDLEDSIVDHLLRYCQELQKWSKRINLIARETSVADILEKHFLDSLLLLPVLQRAGQVPASLLDVGSGAGFPGLVLAIARPDLAVTLLEPRQKRTAFLRHIVRTLALDNVQIREARLEADHALPEQYTFITSRALAAPRAFLSLLAGTARPETLVILMQAEDDQQEFLTACPHWQLVEVLHLKLPFSKHPRTLTIVQQHL